MRRLHETNHKKKRQKSAKMLRMIKDRNKLRKWLNTTDTRMGTKGQKKKINIKKRNLYKNRGVDERKTFEKISKKQT